ncbi:hypothetical protein COT77_00485 [Candidatus Berkelbacteria bacterium CG10_big_fil_rev_8_21_14_0_10_41_12]|uniref:Leucine--tRNA ligase n=1 Tax=Candidatus Berkelbacteria bacterium CG10_big_fil_rev_8_21_14_0_10_41_12 TaxID=1974513 RepID=A0A2M6WXP9_9BACT|nr:MAG: hypothetical protein COT77_00485 [Candidatus Berkelbacteria bacterium CG10_big_fil_rev_8_21_14_0_10_41_12]
MKEYFKQSEKYAIDLWQKEKIFEISEIKQDKKLYCLDMFPYPSGEGLHVGHVKGYVATDIMAKYYLLNDRDVIHPMGWDAFGLPAENYAIKKGVNPQIVTKENISKYKQQLQGLGFGYDWSREINTTDPDYYKWTQWIFLKLYEKGLAYEANVPINFCPSCKTGLANEEVVSGKCVRCGTAVERRQIRQWILRITKYADRLEQDLKDLDWPKFIKQMQINWIGRSEGADITFNITKSEEKIKVFTTRADTLYGCTYIVLAPEHELISKLKSQISNLDEVEKYIKESKNKSDLERTDLQKEKTGVEIKGIKAINPINNHEVSIWVADYILLGYGTGAVMAVPAHDKRDFDFAIKYNLKIKSVIKPENLTKSVVVGPSVEDGFKSELESYNIKFTIGTSSNGREHIRVTLHNNQINSYKKIVQRYLKDKWWVETVGTSELFITSKEIIENYFNKEEEIFKLCQEFEPLIRSDKNLWEMIGTNKFYSNIVCFEQYGNLVNSALFDGLNSQVAKTKITEALKQHRHGDFAINYKLRDWIFSRQRYWGEPIPIIHCKKCGIVPVPERDLPVELPNLEKYEPSGTGDSPLVNAGEWLNVKCPECDGPAKRETNTMPQWAGSCWYYLRYLSPKYSESIVDPNIEKKAMPVDIYVGGAEHAVLHLLYARFWHKFLYDIQAASTNEPFAQLRNVGLILGPDGQKMSKSRGNTVDPIKISEKFGNDTLRMYIMFMGPFNQPSSWNTDGIKGVKKFLDKVFEDVAPDINNKGKLYNKASCNDITSLIQNTSKKIVKMQFNTLVSDFMIFTNKNNLKNLNEKDLRDFLICLSPLAPHLSEFLWNKIGYQTSIFQEHWPQVSQSITQNKKLIIIQVNGKKRSELVTSGLENDQIKTKALSLVDNYLRLKKLKFVKLIYIKDKIINIVAK